MRGIELAEKYYRAVGVEMIETKFPDLKDRIAVGLAGLGTLLGVGMTLTVVANLVLLPAMLQQVRRDPSHTN